MAHLDVVPVDESAPWQHPAFSAEIVDGAIWGRGTLDDKGCVAAICEAVERLLEAGHRPAQDVWLSFGCDEEVSGPTAEAAVDELVRRGVRPWLVLDEGGAVAHGAFPGVKRAVAAIGVAEKGTTERRAPGRRARGARVDSGPQRPDRAARPRDPRDRPLPDAGPAPRHHGRPDAHPRAPRCRGRCGRSSAGPTGSGRCSPGPSPQPAPRRRRWRVRRSRSPPSTAAPRST